MGSPKCWPRHLARQSHRLCVLNSNSITEKHPFSSGFQIRRWTLDKLRFPASSGLLSKSGHLSGSLMPRFAFQFACVSLGLLLAAPVQALSENEIDSLVDEGSRMKELMMRMQSQLNQSALLRSSGSEIPGRNSNISLDLADTSPWASTSAMLDGSLRDRWFRMIEQGVLGRFASLSSGQDQDVQAPAVVGFVHGEEIPWYGSLQVHGYDESSGVADSTEVQARLMVAPRFEDGSFLHVGLSFQSFSNWGENVAFDMLDGGELESQGSGRHLAFDIGYSQESYAIQAQYLKSKARAEGLPFRNRAKENADGFHIRGAWRITGEHTQSRYAPGLLAHIEPRDEEGIWELVVRYANLADKAKNLERSSDSMLLGVHWRADSTLALELDYVEGNGEDFRALNDGGLTLRGILSF